VAILIVRSEPVFPDTMKAPLREAEVYAAAAAREDCVKKLDAALAELVAAGATTVADAVLVVGTIRWVGVSGRPNAAIIQGHIEYSDLRAMG
jgi:hypothetical protein